MLVSIFLCDGKLDDYYKMSQEESTLIDVEKQNMNPEHTGIEMMTQPSRRSLSRAKAFSPPNVDNLASKLRLDRNQLNNIRKRKDEKLPVLKLAEVEDSEIGKIVNVVK